MVASIISKALKKVVKKKPSAKTIKEKAKARAKTKAQTSTTKRKKAEKVFKAPEARTKPSTRDIQTKVLNKAKKQGMTAKNFRMQNPNDKDVKSLYKANPNIKVKDVDRLKMRKIEEAHNKNLVTTAKGKALLKERRKQAKNMASKSLEGSSIRAKELGIPYSVDSDIFERTVRKGGGTLQERARKYMDALERYAKNKRKKQKKK